MILARYSSRSPLKKTPGDRCSCETITRSVPLIMNVPLSVISGISPKKTSSSLISRIVETFVSGSLSNTVRRILTLSGTLYDIPRSWHACWSCLCFRPTGSPQLLQRFGRTALNVPQFVQSTSADEKGSTLILAEQFLQLARRCSRPSRLPHLHCQLPIWYSTNSRVAVSRKSDTGNIDEKTDCSPMKSRSSGSRSICKNLL